MFIIQIGANIGPTGNDPIKNLILDKSNKSILIEPNPYIFEELKENYKENKDNIIFENIAISTKTGTQIFYYDDYELGSSQHASLDINRLIYKKNWLKSRFVEMEIKEIEVPTLTFEDLFTKYNLFNKVIDLLTIDTEGYDALILLSTQFKDMDIKK